MLRRFLLLPILACLAACGGGDFATGGSAAANGYEIFDGFVPLHWDEQQGRLLFRIDAFDTPLLYSLRCRAASGPMTLVWTAVSLAQPASCNSFAAARKFC